MRSQSKVFAFDAQSKRWGYLYFAGNAEIANCVHLRLTGGDDKAQHLVIMKVLPTSPIFGVDERAGGQKAGRQKARRQKNADRQKRDVPDEDQEDAQCVLRLDAEMHNKSARTKDVPLILPKWHGRGSFGPGQKVAILWHAGRLWASTRRSSRCRFICWTVVANLHGSHGHPMPLAIADPDGLGPGRGVAVVVMGYVMLRLSDPTIAIHEPSMTCSVDGEMMCTMVQPEQRENGHVLVEIRTLFDAVTTGVVIPDRYLYAMTRDRDVLLELGREAAFHGLSDSVARFADMLAETDDDIEDFVAILTEWALCALYEGHLDTAGRLFDLGADGDLFEDYELDEFRDDDRIVDLFQLHRFDAILEQ